MPESDSAASPPDDTVLHCEAPDRHQWRSPFRASPRPVAGLVWLPALGVPASKYQLFAEALAGRGIAMAVHEWRGTASSSLRPSRRRDWGYRELVLQDIPATLAAAAARQPGLPWMVGGHSIGGQLAALTLANSPGSADGLVLVATGVPDARTFPGAQRLLVGGFARLVPLLTRLWGHFPGDRLQWAGREAGRLMREWAGTAITGHYRDVGLGADIEDRLARLTSPRLGIRLASDWLVPAPSLDRLLRKLGPGPEHREEFDDARLGAKADHFSWMRQPAPVAETVSAWMRESLSGRRDAGG